MWDPLVTDISLLTELRFDLDLSSINMSLLTERKAERFSQFERRS
jgi:hypothetical protein